MTDKGQEQEQNQGQEQGQDINFDQRSGIETLVARLGGLRPCAAQLGLAVGTVQGWKKRGSIPAAHQQKIRELLHTLAQERTEERTEEKTEAQKKDTDEDISMPTMQENKEQQEKQKKDQQKKQEEAKQEEAASLSSLKASEEATTEEGIVSAFTSGDDFASGDEEGLDISSEVWEHASLPRSTSGQWAILISLIALVGVLTRPLWAEPIDKKLMGTLADGGHGTSQSSESQDSHASDTEANDTEKAAQSSSDQQDGTEADATSSLAALPRDLLARLQGLERDMAGVSAEQSAPAAAELRRLKSESDALSAAFDNQSARLDSLVELLQRRTEALSRLRSQVERLEQNRATERLSRRLNALFQLENIAYAITQRRVFSIEALESSLSSQERQQVEGALALLTQANNLSSPQRLLADYRRLLPELLVWQAMGKAEQGNSERGFVARFAQKLRAQMFGVFSLRRRYNDSLDDSWDDSLSDSSDASSGDAEASLLTVERMLGDGRFQQAEERLAQASPSSAQAREQLGEEVAAKLQAFRSALSARNNVFAALHEIRDALSSRETGDPKTRQPSS